MGEPSKKKVKTWVQAVLKAYLELNCDCGWQKLRQATSASHDPNGASGQIYEWLQLLQRTWNLPVSASRAALDANLWCGENNCAMRWPSNKYLRHKYKPFLQHTYNFPVAWGDRSFGWSPVHHKTLTEQVTMDVAKTSWVRNDFPINDYRGANLYCHCQRCSSSHMNTALNVFVKYNY